MTAGEGICRGMTTNRRENGQYANWRRLTDDLVKREKREKQER